MARSDHWPIRLEWCRVEENLRRPFRMEEFWLNHPDLKILVKQWWKEFEAPRGSVMFKFQQQFKFLNEKITNWNKQSFGNVFKEKKRLEETLQKLHEEAMKRGYMEECLSYHRKLSRSY